MLFDQTVFFAVFAVLPLGLLAWRDKTLRGAGTVAAWAFLIPLIMGAASMAMKAIKKRKEQKAAKAELTAQKTEWERTTRPKLLAHQQAEANKGKLRWSLARSYGLDKAMPGVYDYKEPDPNAINNPFGSVATPKFDWAGLGGEAIGTAASTYAAGQGVSDAEKVTKGAGDIFKTPSLAPGSFYDPGTDDKRFGFDRTGFMGKRAR